MNIPNDCKAAFAQTNITPDFPVEMIGCYRKSNRPDGVLHPLHAQVLLFEHQTIRCCLITIDSLGLTVQLANELREMVAKVLSTSAVDVMLNFSHTHSAPAPKSPVNGQKYFALLCRRIINCAKQALKNLQPCLAAWALGKTDIGENRRNGCTITDKHLGALQITHAISKKPIAVLLRVSAHANTLMSKSQKISSDYIGVARESLAIKWNCPVMIMQGAAGNTKPAGVDTINGGDLKDTLRIANMLVQSALHFNFAPKEITRLQMYETEINFYSDVPSEKEALQIVEKAGFDAKSWLAECARLKSAGIDEQMQTNHIQFLFLNEGCLCGVPDEIFCEIALQIAKDCNDPLLLFNGYTNGCTGYLPHREEWVKGGYETFDSYLQYYMFHGHALPFRADTAERLVNAVDDAYRRYALT
ncbi:MAG: alkaline ceramidase [Oscillospiraceae bacterium]